MVEVFAELAFAHGGVHILVARGEDPAHPPPRPGWRPSRLHLPVLDHLEKLRLELGGKEPDLIKEDRAGVGGLEQSRLRLPGIGESAALETEHLRLEQGGGKGRAIDLHEGPVGARAARLERAREQTLARARLPLNENGRKPRVAVLQELSRFRAEGGHGRAVAEQLGQGLHRAPASRSKAASRLRWQWLASSQ